MRPSWNIISQCFLLLVCLSCATGISAKERTPAWLPISPEDLAMTDSTANPGAPAIILYRETDTDDSQGFETNYYRIKILKEAGRKYADVEVPFVKGRIHVEDIEARTIHPDGKVIDFDGEVYDKVVVKAKGVKFLARTLTLPDVQPGSIIEYKYRLQWQAASSAAFSYPWFFNFLSPERATQWVVQDDLFTRRAHFSFRPIQGPGLQWTWARIPKDKAPENKKGTYELDLEDIPAFEEEEYMPPEGDLKGRVDFFYLYKSPPKKSDPHSTDWFWKEEGKDLCKFIDEQFIGKYKSIENEVKEVTGPNDSPQAKLHKIYQRAQQVRNLSFEREKSEKEEKGEKLKDNHSVEDVLKHGYGYSFEITELFVALARAAGFDTLVVEVPSRRTRFFNPSLLDWRQFSGDVAEVVVGGLSTYLDPGNPYCPYGLLPWEYTSVHALRLEKEGGVFVEMPNLQSTGAVSERRASLELGGDGNLQGKMQVKFMGEEALRRRVDNREKDDLGRKKLLEDEVKESLPAGSTVELTRVGRWDTSEETLEAEFTLKVQGLASSTGRRLLLPLGVLQTNEKNSFQAEKRVYPVYFQYPFQEIDDVSIQLPKEYQVETLASPSPMQMGPLGYEVKGEVTSDTLHVRRHLTVDSGYFRVGAYPSIRQFFRNVRAGDEQQMVLKRVETSPPK